MMAIIYVFRPRAMSYSQVPLFITALELQILVPRVLDAVFITTALELQSLWPWCHELSWHCMKVNLL
jgi:hypothetical protein